jgi:hypothetical protein
VRHRCTHHDDDDLVNTRILRVYAQDASPMEIADTRAIRQMVRIEMPKWAAISRGRSPASIIA